MDKTQAYQVRIGALACMALMAVLSLPAQAFDLDYVLGYEAEHDSNLPFNANGGNEFTHTFFLDADIVHVTPTLGLSLESEIEYNTYQQNRFDDDLRATVTADALWRISPNRFHWHVNERLVQTPLNIQGARNPNNQQDSNVFGTGPDFIFRIGSADRFILGGRYVISDFEARDSNSSFVGNNDSERFVASAAYQRLLSNDGYVGLMLRATSIDFDQALAPDYDRYEGYLEYVYTSQLANQAESRLTVNAGLSEIEIDGRSGLTNPLFRVDWGLVRPEGANFSVTLENSTSDSSDLLGGLVGALDPTNSTEVTITNDVFERTRGTVGVSRAWDSFSAGITGEYGTQDFEVEDLDQDYYRFGANASYALTQLIDLRFAAAIEQRDFGQRGQKDDYVSASFTFSYQRTEHWRWEVDVVWRDRDSTVDGLTADSLAGVLRVSYQR